MADAHPPPPRGARRSARTRAALLDAAEVVFGELGYERASVSAINRQAGVAQGTFYRHFPSKQAAFVEVIKDRGTGARKAAARAVQALPPDADRATIERAGVEASVRFVFAHRHIHRILRDAEHASPDMHRWWFESVVAAYAAGFRRLTPEPRAGLDITMLGYVVMGIGRGLSNRMLADGEPPSEGSMDQVFELLAHGFDGLLGESTPA